METNNKASAGWFLRACFRLYYLYGVQPLLLMAPVVEFVDDTPRVYRG